MEDGQTATPDPGFEPNPALATDTLDNGSDVWAPEPAAVPPLVEPAVMPPAVPPPPSAAPDSKRFPWVTVVVGIAAVAAIVALSVMYVSAASDKDDAEQALAEAQADLADTDAALSESEAALATAESELADTQASLADAEDAQSTADAARTAAETAQAAAEAARDGLEQSVSEYEAVSAEFLAISMGQGLGLNEDDSQCLGEGLVDSLGADALGSIAASAAEGNQGSATAALGAEMMRVAEECGIDSTELEDPASADAFTYGDDPELDALYDDCASGDGAACDNLYLESGLGSDYEQFGGTCGDRFEFSETEPCEGRI